ncbi:plasmid pRiA4b ORF-3 family protein [Candidatus Spongiihabitans sp.]|uniref:plasmid pRiA4b ORF-3 family protein n=1 Tax=Candidatus Spongiihabitans sp. TaxID=3101308 RepID=UPI003C797C9B
MKQKIAYQFGIELLGIEPAIWRLIEVPSNYSFWDLHVAIQDSMGWLDYHLHEFRLLPPRKKKPILIGIPDDEYGGNILPGWEVPLPQYFKEPGDEARYDYDFGDGWQHRITLAGKYLQDDGVKYPACLDGKRACPPEDCSGIGGYYNVVEILANPEHEEYEDKVYWLSNHAKNYHPYDADYFEPSEVKFCNPKKRWKMAFQD